MASNYSQKMMRKQFEAGLAGEKAGAAGEAFDEEALRKLYPESWIYDTYKRGYDKSYQKYGKALALIDSGKSVTVTKGENGYNVNGFVNYNNYDDPSQEVETEDVKTEDVKTEDVITGEGGFSVGVSTKGGSAPNITFAEYIKNYGGVDTDKQYAQNVRNANNSFYRSLMTYGKNAENMAGLGLVGGGMSDYGGAAAYAARQGAVNAAGEIKAQTDMAQAASFAQYLQNEQTRAKAEENAKKQEQSELIKAIVSMGLTDRASIESYVKAVGSSELNVDELMTAIDGINTAKKAKEDEITEETNGQLTIQAQEAYNAARANGLSHENAINQVKAITTDETILGNLESGYQTSISSQTSYALTQTLNDPNYSVIGVDSEGNSAYVNKETLDRLVREGGLVADSDDYNTKLTDIQNKNYESIDTVLKAMHNDGKNGYNLQSVCEQLGIEYNADDESSSALAVLPMIRDRAKELYYAEDISEEQYCDFLRSDLDYELDAVLDDDYANKKNRIKNICALFVDEYVDVCGELENSEFLTELYSKVISEGAYAFIASVGANTNGTDNTIQVNSNNQNEAEIEFTLKYGDKLTDVNVVKEFVIDNKKFAINDNGEIGYIQDLTKKDPKFMPISIDTWSNERIRVLFEIIAQSKATNQ